MGSSVKLSPSRKSSRWNLVLKIFMGRGGSFFLVGGGGGDVGGGERGALWIGLNVPSVCGDHCSNSEC